MLTGFLESAAENSDEPVTKRFIERKHHMSFDFNADDIFEMAEQLERNGAKFYRDASENVTDPQSKKFLIQLSQMEVNMKKPLRRCAHN
jgi:hypothetical protein